MGQRLGDILKALGLLDDEGLAAALRRKAKLGGRIGEHLLAVGAVEEEDLLKGLARQRRVPFADNTMFEQIDERLRRLVPRSKAFHYRIVPVRYIDGFLILATCESNNLERVRELVDALGHRVRLVLAGRAAVEASIERLYAVDSTAFTDRHSLPRPAALRRREQAGEKHPRFADGPDVETAEVSGDHKEVKEERIARELESELPPDSSVFQLTKDTLLRLREVRRRGLESQPEKMAEDEYDTQVTHRIKASKNDALEEEPKTVLDREMAKRIRARWAGRGSSRAPGGIVSGLGAKGGPAVANSGAPPSHPTLPVEVPGQLNQLRHPGRTSSGDEGGPAGTDTFARAQQEQGSQVVSLASQPFPPEEISLSGFDANAYEDQTVPPEMDPDSFSGTISDTVTKPPQERSAFLSGVPVPVLQKPRGEPFGNYLLRRRIKTGGMAVVYEATTEGLEGISRRVAIKRILPNLTDSDEFVTMFIDEAKITVQLNHAAIGQVYELGKVDSDYFIAMEYINGRDTNAIFATAAEKGEPLPIGVAVYIIQQVLEGLDYAHRKCDLNGNSLGIIHRDVSPANVLCSFEGLVKIIDFGIAKAVSKVSLTRPGLIKGKISYMSPEQMRGQPIDRRSDIFAAAIVLYELLSGRRLFVGESDVETIRNVLRGEVPPIRSVRPSLPEDLAAVVHSALSRDPQKRPQWASDMSHDLQRSMVRNGYHAPRAELVKYMSESFGGIPAGEEVLP